MDALIVISNEDRKARRFFSGSVFTIKPVCPDPFR